MKPIFKIFLLSLILTNCSNAFAQNKQENDTTQLVISKSKKTLYIENYIANFPYKNTDIYVVIKQTNLWDTTGTVPVINANTISANLKPKIYLNNKSENKSEKK